jgi:hypothetical protein
MVLNDTNFTTLFPSEDSISIYIWVRKTIAAQRFIDNSSQKRVNPINKYDV